LARTFGKALWKSPLVKHFEKSHYTPKPFVTKQFFPKALSDYTQITKALWDYAQIPKALCDYTQIRIYPEQSCPMNLNDKANIPAAQIAVEQFNHGGKYPGCYCHTTALGKLTFIEFKITDAARR